MSISLNNIDRIGQGLVRPECVLATQAGFLYVSDFRGGVSQISPNGDTFFFGGGDVEGIGKLQPNGICLLQDGSFLVAHLGATSGGIYRIYRDNRIKPYLTQIQGEALPPSNFVYLDHQGRIWVTVSTRKSPRADAYRSNVSDGFIAVIDQNGARIVADNIGYTNEVFVTPDGNTLYANATFARETLAFDIAQKNKLTNKRCVARYGLGIFPDGLTMDVDGMLWITSIVSNSIIKVNPISSEYSVELQDVDPNHLQWVEKAFQKHQMGSEHLSQSKSQHLKNISSLAFGGDNLQTMFLGCLLGDSIANVPAKRAGIKPAHWKFDPLL